MDKPVKLKVGDELMKQRGKTGPVRTVERLRKSMGGLATYVTLKWTQHTKRKGTETLETTHLVQDNGLPAGYVLAKDRAAKRGGK